MFSRSCIFLACIFSLIFTTNIEARFNKKEKAKPKPIPKPVRLNTDGLQTLPEILENLDLTGYMNNFIRSGITETRLLLRLSNMDYQLMLMEWDMPEEKMKELKSVAEALYVKAIVPDEAARPELDARKKLKYGRIYISDSVQSHEYVAASFGGPPPIGKIQLKMEKSPFGCESDDLGDDHEGHFVFVNRGNCTFLEKALLAKRKNAMGLIVVNNEDKLESASSGLGVDRSIKEDIVLSLGDFPVISVANTSWAKLALTSRYNAPASAFAHIVPLKCMTGGKCIPVLEEEKALQAEVSWGSMRAKIPAGEVRSFEFLSSTFGANLPLSGSTPLVLANPITACGPLRSGMEGKGELEILIDPISGVPAAHEEVAGANPYMNAAVLVHRGDCRFDEKALHVQNTGARLVVVVDVDDSALQRMGGHNPTAGYVGIPQVLVTKHAGDYLSDVLLGDAIVSLEMTAGEGAEVTEMWIELAYTEWEADDQARLMQTEGLIQKFSARKGATNEIMLWLHRQRDNISDKYRKNMDTDV